MLVSYMYIYIAAAETEFKLLMSAAERLPNVRSRYLWPFQCLGTSGFNLDIMEK